MGSGVNVHPWSAYLPKDLQPLQVRAAHATASASGDASTAAGGSPALFCLDASQVAGQVWRLSQEAQGCRQVQQALEEAPSDEVRENLAFELRGHVAEACRCPHANHVVQKLILLLPTSPTSSTQFIIDELAGEVASTARHKYGCRIIQRLVEQYHPDQVEELVETMLEDIQGLSRHMYGNYVIQNLLQHGSDEHRRRIASVVVKDIRVLGSESHGCAVVSAALSCGPGAERGELAQVLLREPGLLVFLAGSRQGHVAVLRALDLFADGDLKDARSLLWASAEELRSSRFGRTVLEYMESDC